MRRMLETHTAENLVHIHMWVVLVEYFPSTIDTRSRVYESAIHIEEADDEGSTQTTVEQVVQYLLHSIDVYL